MKPIVVLSQQELTTELKDKRTLPDHLISIGSPRFFWSPRLSLQPGMPRLFRSHFRQILRLEFFDVERRDQLGKIRPFVIPELKHAAAVLKFWEKTHHKANGYVVHCHAGISRSTAVGLALLFRELGEENLALEQMLTIRPQAAPNRLLVRHFDTLLGSQLLPGAVRLHDNRLKTDKEWFYNEYPEWIEELEPSED